MKKALSLILVLVMVVGMMPMTAFATEATGNADDAEILRQLARETSFPLGNISGNIAVLGDSTISGYPKYSALSTYFSVADGYTITDISKAGDTIVGQLNKWKALSVTEKSALNYVFVQIGLNDTDETAETFRAQYTSLIAQIRADAPDAMLILGTMVPCKQRWKVLYPNTWEEHQERWEIANEDIQNGYYDCDSVAYLHTEALGLDGNLRKEYNHGDHIHENAEGAKVIAYSWYLAAFGHSHRYSSIVTSPTCTEPGYTTYTCECGESYVGDYVDAVGHTYENGICIGCGATQPGPVITQQPESVQQEIGKKFAITVKAEGDGLTYQWYVKESGAKAFKVSSNKTASYAYTMQTYMHNRQVYCVITDANGNSVQTETATITRPPQTLKILEQPQDAQQEIGQKFSIKPSVQGDGLTYQWYYKESYMKDFAVSSNKTSAYAYTMQSYMHNRSVYCVITDQYGNQVTTDVATISLPPVELKILEQPADVYASKGEKFSIKPTIQGDGLTYQWYYKEGYMKDFKLSSNKTSAYAYSMQTYMNERSVYCVITDKYGNQVVTEVVTIHLEK